MDIMRQQRVSVTETRAVDHVIAPGVQPDMTEHGADRDDWPAIREQVMAADMLVLMGPTSLGQHSSVAMQVVARLYSYSGVLDDVTRKSTTLMTGNLLHLARLLKDSGGVPAHGNQRPAWSSGERFGSTISSADASTARVGRRTVGVARTDRAPCLQARPPGGPVDDDAP